MRVYLAALTTTTAKVWNNAPILVAQTRAEANASGGRMVSQARASLVGTHAIENLLQPQHYSPGCSIMDEPKAGIVASMYNHAA